MPTAIAGSSRNGNHSAIQSPKSPWSEQALGLLKGLGVRLERFETAFDRSLYPGLGLSRGMFFTKEAFDTDTLVSGDPTRMVADDIPRDRLNARAPAAFIGDFPLSATARRQLLAVYTEAREVIPGKSRAEKEQTGAWQVTTRGFCELGCGVERVCTRGDRRGRESSRRITEGVMLNPASAS